MTTATDIGHVRKSLEYSSNSKNFIILLGGMEAERRKSVRLMSSLMDLKLLDATKTTESSSVENKLPQGRPRNNKKIMAIKGLAEDTIIHEIFERVEKVLTDAD